MAMRNAAPAVEPKKSERHLRAFFSERAVDPDAQAVAHTLFAAYENVFSYIEGAALRPLGLTHAGYVLLLVLWGLGPAEPRELARVQRVSKPAIVGVVNTLERRKLVRRVRSDIDRRLVTVELTPAGRALVERAQVAAHAYERRIAARLSRQEQRTLVALLAKIEGAARQQADADHAVARAQRSKDGGARWRSTG